jgi:hypothetical protein
LVILYVFAISKKHNESIALFGDKEAGGIVITQNYSEYYHGTRRAKRNQGLFGCGYRLAR